MKRLFATGCAALLSGAAFSAGSVGGVTVTQNWPWDARVFIDFTLTGDAGKTYDLALKVESPKGPVAYKANALDRELINMEPGSYRLAWDPSGILDSTIDVAAIGMKFTLTCAEASSAGKYMVIDISDPDDYTVAYLNDVPAGGWGDDYLVSKMAFRRISPGTFLMGSPADEEGHLDKRNTSYLGLDAYGELLHRVNLTNEYWIAVHPATGGHICNLDTRATKKGDGTTREGGTIDYKWDQNGMWPCYALNYTRLVGTGCITQWPTSTTVGDESLIGQVRARLAGKNTPAGLVFHLPTDAQWEYACRAGTETSWNNGTDCHTNSVGVDANLDLLGRYTPKGNSSTACRAKVGQLQPNAWGLYDCHGNIGEIVADGIRDNVSTAETEPPGGSHTANIFCFIRGGCYNYAWAVHMRSAAHYHSNQYSDKDKTAEASSIQYHSARFAFIRPLSGGKWQ